MLMSPIIVNEILAQKITRNIVKRRTIEEVQEYK